MTLPIIRRLRNIRLDKPVLLTGDEAKQYGIYIDPNLSSVMVRLDPSEGGASYRFLYPDTDEFKSLIPQAESGQLGDVDYLKKLNPVDVQPSLKKLYGERSLDEIKAMADTDTENFVQNLQVRGRTKDTEAVLRAIGATDSDINEVLGQEALTKDQLMMQALPKIKPDILDWARKYYAKNTEQLKKHILEEGRNAETEALVKATNPKIDEKGLNDYFGIFPEFKPQFPERKPTRTILPEPISPVSERRTRQRLEMELRNKPIQNAIQGMYKSAQAHQDLLDKPEELPIPIENPAEIKRQRDYIARYDQVANALRKAHSGSLPEEERIKALNWIDQNIQWDESVRDELKSLGMEGNYDVATIKGKADEEGLFYGNPAMAEIYRYQIDNIERLQEARKILDPNNAYKSLELLSEFKPPVVSPVSDTVTAPFTPELAQRVERQAQSTIADLNWRKAQEKGERNFYNPETDIWELVSGGKPSTRGQPETSEEAFRHVFGTGEISRRDAIRREQLARDPNPIIRAVSTPTIFGELTPSDIAGIGILGVGGVQAARVIYNQFWGFSRLPQYRGLVQLATQHKISRNSPSFRNLETVLKTAYNLHRSGMTELADEIIGRFNKEYAEATAARPLSLGTRPIPTATQTAAMAMGGLPAKGNITEVAGNQIAKELSVTFNGIQKGTRNIPDSLMFTDTAETGGSFTAASLVEARTKLAEMRAKFAGGKAPPVEVPKVEPQGVVPEAKIAETSLYKTPPGRTEVPQFGEPGAIPEPTPPDVAKASRRRVIEARLQRGEPVSDKLLAEFPDLQAKPAGVPEPPMGQPPSELPPEVIPPPVAPQPGQRIMGDLQNADELVKTMTNPDYFRSIANLPAIRSVMKYFSPAGVANSPVEQAVVARPALREEGQNKAIGAFSTLQALGNRQQVWGKLDYTGKASSLGTIKEGKLAGLTLDEVLTYRTKYASQMTPEQKAWADQFHAIEADKLDFLKRNGIEINELSFEEGGEYVGRRVLGRLDDTGNLVESAYVGSPGPGRPGAKMGAEKARVFRDMNEALVQGYRYLPPDEALFLNIKGAYNRVADKQVSDWVLERIPWRTSAAPETLILARDVARDKLATSLRLKSLLNRAVRGERVTVDAALSKDLPQQAQELTDLVPSLQKGDPVAARVIALTGTLNDIIKQNKQDFRDIAKRLTEARERALRPHLQEGSVISPAFSGKILTGVEAKKNAEILNRSFNAQFGDIDRILMAVNKVNAVGRFFVLAGDASIMAIQLIGFPARFPIIYARSGVIFIKALFSEKAQASYIARNNDVIQKSRNLLLSKGGQTEYTEAFRSGGLFSKGPGKVLQPFQRAFEGAMDTAGIELRKAFDHLATTPQRTAEVEQFINEIRGLTSSARIGVSPHLRQAETAVFLAPRYNRAVAALLSDVVRGGIRGDQARKAMIALMGGGVALATAITLAKGEGWERVKDHLNPQSNDFMTWEAAGQRIGFGSKFRSLMNLAGRISKNPEQTIDYANRFIRAQFAPVLGTGIDVISGKDYIGEPTRPGKGVGFTSGMLGLTRRVVADNAIPLWLNSVLFEGGNLAGRLVRGAAEFVGGRGYPSPNAEAAEKVGGFIQQLGKEDTTALENALKDITDPEMMREIKTKDWIYDIKSVKRDIAQAIRFIDPLYLNEKSGFSPLVPEYVKYQQQLDGYEGIATKNQPAYLKRNPVVLVSKYFWGDWSDMTPPSNSPAYGLVNLQTANQLKAMAQRYNIPLNLIPAFGKTDSGKERMPPETLWKDYFDYYALTKIDKKTQKVVADTTKREAFRRSHKEFDTWGQANLGWQPLSAPSTTRSRGF